MKSLTKKAILLASVVAAAGTFAVCAASIDVGTDGTLANPTTDNRTVTVPFTTDVADSDQITILAYKVDDMGNGTPDTSNIVYIDQMAKSAASGNQIVFSLRDNDVIGKYKVLMGGTGVATAGAATFELKNAVGPSAGITGTVSPSIYFGEDAEMAEYNEQWKVSIALQTSDFIDVKSVDAVAKDDLGSVAFKIDDVADGDYYLAISRLGMCTKYVAVTVTGGAAQVGDVVLLGSDMTADGPDLAIDGSDVAALLDQIAAANYDENYDGNADYSVDGTDVSGIIEAIANFEGYQGF